LMTNIGVIGWTFLLVLAHPGCVRENPESCKTVVCVCVWRQNTALMWRQSCVLGLCQWCAGTS